MRRAEEEAAKQARDPDDKDWARRAFQSTPFYRAASLVAQSVARLAGSGTTA